MRFIPARQCGSRCGFRVPLARLTFLAILAGVQGWCQSVRAPQNVPPQPATGQVRSNGDASRNQSPPSTQPFLQDQAALSQLQGLPVRKISFEGVSAERLKSLQARLALKEGAPLNLADISASLRQLFASGLFDTVEVAGEREGDGVALIFRGKARTFIGTVSVQGARGATMNTQLERASRLSAGTRFTPAKMTQALEQMRLALAQNGYNESTITNTLDRHPDQQLVDITFHVVSGPQARIGSVAVSGDAGMSSEEFRHHAHLRAGATVDHETVNRADDSANHVSNNGNDGADCGSSRGEFCGE